MNETNWAKTPAVNELSDTDVHVWRASVLASELEVARYRALLTPEEIARADRFRFDKHRIAFMVRRGILRELVGKYIGGGPFLHSFPLNSYGKPNVPIGEHSTDLRFSISHSNDRCLLAFTLGRDIGVDIEAVRTNIDYCALSDRFFSPFERETLRSLPAAQQCDAFFSCWSRKEAYIKARGMGLSMPLDQFDVSLSPGETAQLLATRDDPANAERWAMHAIDAGPGFASTLVVEGHGLKTGCFDWDMQEGVFRGSTK